MIQEASVFKLIVYFIYHRCCYTLVAPLTIDFFAKNLKCKQSIREEGPSSHQKIEPDHGGILFPPVIIVALISTMLSGLFVPKTSFI